MSMSANVAIPTPPVPIAENQNPEMSPSLEIACDKGVCVWKKTTSKTIKRANGFIASSRVLHGAGLDSKSPEEREDENNEMKEEETQKTMQKEISLPAPPPGDISDDEPEYAPRKNEIDMLDSDDLLEIDDDYDNGGMLCDGDLCDVAPSEMHSPTPLVFHYRGSQRDRGKKDGPIDISEIFVKTVSILKDSEEDSHSLVSVLDSQRVKLTNERNSGKELGQQLIQICIPEHKLVKMVVFSPLQTISSFVDTLLGSIAKSEQPDDYQMVFPIFLDGSISAFSLDSNAVFGIYGIGMNEDEVPPTLFLFHKTTDNVYDIPKYESFLGTKVSSKEDAKIDAWVKILTSWNAFPPGSVAHATIQKTISKMAVAGIPPAIRGWAWRQISGSSTLANEHPSLYADLLAKALKTPPSYMRKINVDLPRSLPRHPFFAKEESFGQPALKRVLLAFGQYEEAIGYCQGVNFLAATLLCFMDEEVRSIFLHLCSITFIICFHFISLLFF